MPIPVGEGGVLSLIKLFILLNLFYGTSSCGEDQAKKDERSQDLGGSVASEGQQSSDGDSSGDGQDEDEASKASTTSVPEPENLDDLPLGRDLRPDASLTYQQPSVDADLDPRDFSPSGTYVEGRAGRLVRSLSYRIAVPYDGRSYSLPACLYPMPAPSYQVDPSLIVVDGSLSEWPLSSLAVVDRKGDGPGGDSAFDLVNFYWAYQEDYYYLGFEMAADWSTESQTVDRLLINFLSLSIPSDDDSVPSGESRRVLEVFGNQLWEETDGNYAELPGSVDYEIATNGAFVEIKIARSEIDSRLGDGPFVVEVRSFRQEGKTTDRIGTLVSGLSTDYSCLVPVLNPDGQFDGFKLVILHRAGEVSPELAEAKYRSLINAIPAVTKVVGQAYQHWDTINLIVTEHMLPAGLYVGNLAIFLNDEITNPYGEDNLPLRNFFVAAHEYAHGYNGSDYGMPETWMREGHSDWVATQAVGNFFGEAAAQLIRADNIDSFLREEAENSAHDLGIDDDNWGNEPLTPLFYYRKAAAWFELTVQRLDLSELVNEVFLKLRVKAITALEGFVNAIKVLGSYVGEASDDLQSGWFEGDYSSATITPSADLLDGDYDGLYVFQEKQHALSGDQFDSDQDGLSDGFEVVHGLNPSVADSYQYIAVDHWLSEWAKLEGVELATRTEFRNTETPCGGHSNISSYAVYHSDDWAVIGVQTELVAQAENEVQVIVFLTRDSGDEWQLITPWGKSYSLLKDSDNNLIRSIKHLAPFRSKGLELAINLAWMGWEAWPEDLKFRIATFAQEQQCDYTELVSSSKLSAPSD